MKKILSTAAAFTLAMGLAVAASAADAPKAAGYDRSKDTPSAPGIDMFSIKGFYQVVGAYQSDGNGAGSGVALHGFSGSENGDDSFWFHSFVITPTMNIGDKITMVSELRFADRDVWGFAGGPLGSYNGGNSTSPDQNPHLDGDLGLDQGRQIDVRKIYMEYMSPIGKFRMGRVPVAARGNSFIDSAYQGNRLMWWPVISGFPAKPWSSYVFVQKVTEGDVANSTDDTDADYYSWQVQHTSDMGNFQIAYDHVRNASFGLSGVDDVATQQAIWSSAKYEWKQLNNLTVEGELQWWFGENGPSGGQMVDRDAWAAYLDVSGKFGNLTVGGLYFFMEGQSRTDKATDERTDAMRINGGNGVGDDFQPFQILTGDYTGILSTDKADGVFTGARVKNAGAHSFGVKAAYQVTPKFKIDGIIGGAWADEEQYAGQDDSYGIEYDLNASYKLLDNLTYGLHFGYLDTGDYFETLTDNNHTLKTNNITFIANGLTMTF